MNTLKRWYERGIKPWVFPGVMVLGAAGLAAASYFMADKAWNEKFATILGALTTAVAFPFAIYMLRQAKEANEFSVLSGLHAKLNEKESIVFRRYLFQRFDNDFAQVVTDLFHGKDLLTNGRVDAAKVETHVEENTLLEKQLNEKLLALAINDPDPRAPEASALEAVERVLYDFDLVLIPYVRGSPSAIAAVEDWKTVFKKTSQQLLPFVMLKRKLRGKRDETYKYHYLRLLKDIGCLDSGTTTNSGQAPPTPVNGGQSEAARLSVPSDSVGVASVAQTTPKVEPERSR